MTATEDRARAAMRAIAGTVHDAPPLRLTPAKDLAPAPDGARLGGQGSPHADSHRRIGSRRLGLRGPGGAARPGNRGRGRRLRWSWLAPVAAAVAVAAVALALVLIRDIPNGRVAAPAPAVTSAAGPTDTPRVVPTGVPEYYVAWMQANTPHLVVGDTFTGKEIATVKAPAGVYLNAVYGTAADDRTFIVTGNVVRGVYGGPEWYLLRIAPGSSVPARLTPLPVPVRQNPAGVALSPDGTKVAVALPGSPATVQVYSVPNGKLLRTWSTTAPGQLTAQKLPAGTWQFTLMVLRWSADGSQLAFAWNATAIRVLDATAPDGDLVASSRQLAVIGTTYATEASFTCHATQGWQLITIAKGAEAGQGIVCGASLQSGQYTICTSPTDTKCKYTQRDSIGFLRATHNGQGGSFLGLDNGSDCPGQAEPGTGAYLGWANADGGEVIGSQVCAGHSRYGIFRGSTFTPLPALPESMPAPAGVMYGTVAW